MLSKRPKQNTTSMSNKSRADGPGGRSNHRILCRKFSENIFSHPKTFSLTSLKSPLFLLIAPDHIDERKMFKLKEKKKKYSY